MREKKETGRSGHKEIVEKPAKRDSTLELLQRLRPRALTKDAAPAKVGRITKEGRGAERRVQMSNSYS